MNEVRACVCCQQPIVVGQRWEYANNDSYLPSTPADKKRYVHNTCLSTLLRETRDAMVAHVATHGGDEE